VDRSDRFGSREYLDAYRSDELGSPGNDPVFHTRFIVWTARAARDAFRWAVRTALRR